MNTEPIEMQTAEASELGWPPGVWPDCVGVDEFGPYPFLKVRHDEEGNAVYRQRNTGRWLYVFND